MTFPPGSTSGTIGVTVIGDTIDENDETFTVTLSNPVGAGPGAAATATGTIQDDDAPPQISISDCAADEGALCGFGPTLSQVSGKTVTVNYATASGSATSGTDFVPASGVAVFTPGSPAVAINVQAIDDTIDEIDEAFVGQPDRARQRHPGRRAGHGVHQRRRRAAHLRRQLSAVIEGTSDPRRWISRSRSPRCPRRRSASASSPPTGPPLRDRTTSRPRAR